MKPTWLRVVPLCLAGGGLCGPTRMPEVKAPEEARQQAARDLECAETKIAITEHNGADLTARGCEREARYRCFKVPFGFQCLLLSDRLFIDQAASDLACPVDQVAVKNLGGGEFRATGCDHIGTYQCKEAPVGGDCELSALAIRGLR